MIWRGYLGQVSVICNVPDIPGQIRRLLDGSEPAATIPPPGWGPGHFWR
jgi:hypothetical protein